VEVAPKENTPGGCVEELFCGAPKVGETAAAGVPKGAGVDAPKAGVEELLPPKLKVGLGGDEDGAPNWNGVTVADATEGLGGFEAPNVKGEGAAAGCAVEDFPKLKTLPVDADLVTDVPPKVLEVDVAVLPPNAFEDVLPKPEVDVTAVPNEGVFDPNGLVDAAF